MSEAEARATNRGIALVDAGGSAATSALLADAAAALPVYARLAGMEAPELVWPSSEREFADCDTVLLALMAKESVTQADGLARGTRVYALTCTGDERPDPGDFARLKRECEARGLTWMGGLAVGEADLLPQMAIRPRMGWARRRVSEAVDLLLIALLAGQSFGEKYVRPSRYAHLTCRPR